MAWVCKQGNRDHGDDGDWVGSEFVACIRVPYRHSPRETKNNCERPHVGCPITNCDHLPIETSPHLAGFQYSSRWFRTSFFWNIIEGSVDLWLGFDYRQGRDFFHSVETGSSVILPRNFCVAEGEGERSVEIKRPKQLLFIIILYRPCLKSVDNYIHAPSMFSSHSDSTGRHYWICHIYGSLYISVYSHVYEWL
jgi:hypothetical protein